MKRIFLISCVKSKLDHRAKARDLYISTLFKSCLAYANKLRPDAIYILSAKYGLLELEQEIEPYELTLRRMADKKKEWARKVLGDLSGRTDIRSDHFIILAGLEYRKYLTPHMKSYEVPLEGLAFGLQLQRLKELIDE